MFHSRLKVTKMSNPFIAANIWMAKQKKNEHVTTKTYKKNSTHVAHDDTSIRHDVKRKKGTKSNWILSSINKNSKQRQKIACSTKQNEFLYQNRIKKVPAPIPGMNKFLLFSFREIKLVTKTIKLSKSAFSFYDKAIFFTVMGPKSYGSPSSGGSIELKTWRKKLIRIWMIIC